MTNVKVGLGIAGFLLFLFAVVALIFFGIRTHKEEGFLDICWHLGRAQYVQYLKEGETPRCARPKIIMWQRIPVRVASITDKEWQREAIIQEIKHINRLLGFTLISPVVMYDSTTDVDLRIIWDVPRIENRLGGCSHWKLRNGNLIAQIQMHKLVFDSTANHVLSHELGHCVLGLHHDKQRSSTMFRESEDTMWFSGPKFRDFTDHDIKLVRKHYGF